MAKDALAQFALQRARAIVAPDGQLDLKEVRDNVAFVRYRVRKGAPGCAQCAVGPDDLRHFLEDVFRTSAPHIKEFDIEVEEIPA